MKKFFSIATALFLFGSVAFAQNHPVSAKKPATPASGKLTHTKATPAKTIKATPAHNAVAPAAATGKTHMKKNGAPDMRYKENKKPMEEHKMKKDGSADMRYKANKQAPKKEGKPMRQPKK